jgi:hypothetical protein
MDDRMTPVHCRVKHDPENGTYGDCMRACVATIMDVADGDEVPHFYHDNCDGETGTQRLREWLRPQGLSSFIAHYDGSISLTALLSLMAIVNAETVYILFGRTTGGDHVVVCKGGKVIHDPIWYPSTLIGPGSLGIWSIMVITKS